MKNILVFPSILSGDFAKLGEEAKRLEEAGADGIHIDIMDGHFVPNLTLGPKAVAAIRRSTQLFLDVHLMIYNPFDYIERFVEAGAHQITFHFEATEQVLEVLNYIKKCNIQAGLAFSPKTSSSFIPSFLPYCDLILLMTVEPGFGGQSFLKEVLEKIEFARHCIDKRTERKILIQVDGGIHPETAKLAVSKGADVLVAGTYLFEQPQMAQAIQLLKKPHLS